MNGELWTDWRGRSYPEKSACVPDHDGVVPRVKGSIESLWRTSPTTRPHLAAQMQASRNPLFGPPNSDGACEATWIIRDERLTAALLWVNGIFDFTDTSASEFSRLAGSDYWVLSLRVPTDWLASFRIATWHEPTQAPWRTARGRMAVRRAAYKASVPDPRAAHRIGGAHGDSSLAIGPQALRIPNHVLANMLGSVEEIYLPATGRWNKQHVWLYSPPSSEPLPLLVLFDGQVWHNSLALDRIVDSMIATGELPPLHIALVDSFSQQRRWHELGVPCQQAEFAARGLVPYVQAIRSVAPGAENAIVSGQSLGGLAALWSLTLSDTFGHAIAQSPSLWRFDLTSVLHDDTLWHSITLQVGRFEGAMLDAARDVAAQLPGRTVRVQAVNGGHDWAWWLPYLITELQRMLSESR
ncbi:MAG: alpha/beta hydrolase-fold protein [Ancrocorticia sp.]|nr:alpha/beta hydrolase-fold protein [Ancrocorticia sp.]MCI2002137.1 alpha/beta hydrolase-fold protein [Ancrocorticia sp.]